MTELGRASPFRRAWPVLGLAVGAVGIMFAAVTIWAARSGRSIAYFTRDPISAVSSSEPAYAGFVSSLGVVVWSFAAAACLLTGFVLNGLSTRPGWLFFMSAGLLTTLLMFDDLFLLHEEVAPDRLNIPEEVVYMVYGLLTLAFFVRFRAELLSADYVLLIVACGAFFVSITSDLVLLEPVMVSILDNEVDMSPVIEDGPKFLGITLWSWYFCHFCVHTLRHTVAGGQK